MKRYHLAIIFCLVCWFSSVAAEAEQVKKESIIVESISMSDYCWLTGYVVKNNQRILQTFLVQNACTADGQSCLPCGENEAAVQSWKKMQLNIVTNTLAICEHQPPCQPHDATTAVEAIIGFSIAKTELPRN